LDPLSADPLILGSLDPPISDPRPHPIGPQILVRPSGAFTDPDSTIRFGELGFHDPGFHDSGFDDPGFSDPGFDDPGFKD
jgi:hypothetical protein